jgi:DNA-binding response OmpR family regulator
VNTDKYSVLVVDDDRDILWTFGRHLLKCGFHVVTCFDGEEAMSVLEAKHFDLMLTDLRMPKVDGLALIEWAREKCSDMKVILITGFGSRAIRNLSDTKSVVYLEKPVDLEDLVDTVTEILSASDHKGLCGTVADIDLIEYLQLLVVCGRKAVLEVAAGEHGTFRVFVRDGRIEYACGDDCHGEEAVYKCVECDQSTFTTIPWTSPPGEPIQRPSRAVLTEAAARRDRKRT